jgi:centrosomal protein CEP41
MIIVYLHDEKLGIPVANQLFERGFENIFLLSGGIEKFHEEHPDLVEGTDVPPSKPKAATLAKDIRKT